MLTVLDVASSEFTFLREVSSNEFAESRWIIVSNSLCIAYKIKG